MTALKNAARPVASHVSFGPFRRTVARLVLALCWLGIHPAQAAAPVVRLGADLPGRKACVGASGPRGVVIDGQGLRIPLDLPVGRVTVEARIRSNGKGVSLRQRTVAMTLGSAAASQTLEALDGGLDLTATFVNRTSKGELRFEFGMLTSTMQKELTVLQAGDIPLARPGALDLPAKAAGGEDALDSLMTDLEQGAFPDVSSNRAPVVLLERIRIVSGSGPVLVRGLATDRITYPPGGKGTLTLELENLAGTPVRAGLAVSLVTGLDSRTELLAATEQVPAGGTISREAPFAVGDALWGRGFEVVVTTPEGADRAAHAVSVVTNPWMAAMHGRGTAMSGSERWSPDEARIESEKIAQANMTDYCNIYEAFAWAPCDYSKMTVDDDLPFFSGQTQYCKKRSSLQALHEVFHRRGLHAITYGKACASGLPGLEYSLAHPERMNIFGHAGFAHESIDVDVIDRMIEGRYRRHGRDEDFWQMWISDWTHYGNYATTDYGCDEIARSASMFGWDGVRYDGAWQVWNDPAATARLLDCAQARIRKQAPGFVFGYNHCGPRHDDRAGAFSDIEMAAMARNGGLVMSEYYRGLGGPARLNIAHLQNVGDAVRLHGGYFLCIFDDGSLWNSALVMAAGARPMGGGGLKKFATRFSQYMLDPALRRLEDPGKVIRPAADPRFRWDAFIYERVAAPDRSQLILQLVNLSDDTTFGSQYAPPTRLNPPRRDLVFDLALPEGYRAERVFATGDADTFEPMAARLDGARLLIPEVSLWTMVVVELQRQGNAPALADVCAGPPLVFAAAPATEALDEKAQLRIGASVGAGELAAINQARVKVTPEILEKVLALGLPEDTAPGEKAYAGADYDGHQAGRDAGWYKGPDDALALVRNGQVDIHYARGVYYHRNRLAEAFAGIPGAVATDSCLRGGGMGALAADNPGFMQPWPNRAALARHDVVVLDGIPMPAMTLPQRRDTREFVRVGGGLLALGGWYSLTKGEYEGSFVEEALPARCKQSTYLQRVKPEAGALRCTPAFARVLGVAPPTLGEAQAMEWVNPVEVRPGAEVLMTTAGGLPVLVAGTFGKGRVILWAGSHVGLPAAPWWQSAWWPEVARACLAYLAAGADASTPPDLGLRDRAEGAKATLNARVLDDSKASFADTYAALRAILAMDTEENARFVARYMLDNPDMIEPKEQSGFTDRILPFLQATPEWAALVRGRLDAPPLGYGRLVAEMAAAAITNLPVETVLRWDIDDITRLRCLAAGADAEALPRLRTRAAELDAREAKWAVDESQGMLCPDQYATRLLRPYVTWALIRCGQRDEETVFRFAKACLDLAYYRWRQEWVLANCYGSLQEVQKSDNRALIGAAESAIIRCQKSIREMEGAMDFVRPRFTPDVIGGDPQARRAIARAMVAADCHKALPLALDYMRRTPRGQLQDFAALRQANLPGVRHMYDALTGKDAQR